MASHGVEIGEPEGASNSMKRAHRRLHVLTWLVLAPVLAAVLWLAVTHRQLEPVNETLPSVVLEEVG